MQALSTSAANTNTVLAGKLALPKKAGPQHPMHEHPFAQYVRILGKGKTGSRSLSAGEAEEAFAMILRGEVEDVQLGAFLMLLRVKEESSEELAGFVRAVRHSIPKALTDTKVDLDWATYAGKRRQQPWYLLAALALADSGVRVVMHGAGGHTAQRVYSEQVLRALGQPVVNTLDEVDSAVADGNFAYLPLSVLCPPLQRIIDLRNHFGLRSPVHTLARLINPFAAPFSMQSIFHPAYADSHQQAAALLGQANAAVFKGEAGEVERKPEAVCRVKTIINGELGETVWPKLIDGRQAWLESLPVDDLRKAWQQDDISDYGRLAIQGTIAIALQLRHPERTEDQCLVDAEQVWRDRNRQRLA